MHGKYIRRLMVLILFCGLVPLPVFAKKTDSLVLVNGNVITGEVKSVDFGQVSYGTDSMGTVSIDWEDVVSVISDQDLQIELADGTRYFGALVSTEERFHVRIKTASQEQNLKTAQIVRIIPIETGERFLSKLDGSFSFGVQAQKANSVTTSNLAGDVSYRTRAILFGLRFASAVTSQSTEPTSARQNVSFNYQRFRPNRWFTDWFTGAERNDELGIDSRLSAGVAIGRFIAQSNKNRLSLAVGAQGAQSTLTNEEGSETAAEGRIEVRYLHRKLVPEADLTFTGIIYPLLDDFSRFRAESDLSLRREIISDLFLDVSVGYSYLSDPEPGAATSDYVATTSLGYSF